MTPQSVHQVRGETVTLEEDLVPTGKPIRDGVSPYPAVQPLRRDVRVVTRRSLAERLFSLPWRPFHHVRVRVWRGVQTLEVEGSGRALDIKVWPGARPAEELEIDAEEFILDLGFLCVVGLGAWYVIRVWEP